MRKGEGVKMTNQEMYDAIDSVYQYLLAGGCDNPEVSGYGLFNHLTKARDHAWCFVVNNFDCLPASSR